MSRNSSVVCAVAAILFAIPFASVLRAQDPPTPFQGANPAALRKVSCHGVSSVPMTSDADQALPLKLVANIPCGEIVLTLSAPDGYTVKILAADGTSGFIAGMYLKKLPPAPRAMDASTLKNGVARWDEGVPGCNRFVASDGSLVESVSLDNITVQVSLYDTGWKFRAQVAIANDSPESIQVDPSKFVLDEIGANGKPLFYNDPAQLAKTMTHEVLWNVANAAPDPRHPVFRSSNDSEAKVLAYRNPTERPLSATNYLLSHQTAEDDAVDTQKRQTFVNYSKQVRALALKPGVIPPGEITSGAVWFDRTKNPAQLMLRIPVDALSFEFPLTFKPVKQ
jgi:hypothetical protein